ncbi:hypothetical protein ACFQY9_24310 [Microvirga aerilata]
MQVILALSEDGALADPEWESLGHLIRKPYHPPQVFDLVARCLNWPTPPDE